MSHRTVRYRMAAAGDRFTQLSRAVSSSSAAPQTTLQALLLKVLVAALREVLPVCGKVLRGLLLCAGDRVSSGCPARGLAP
jgi:hypothetical protein